MTLCCLTGKQHQNTCNYWYAVRDDVIWPHTAFTTREALMLWLNERGLKLTEPLPEERGTWQYQKIIGTYSRNMIIDRGEFDALQGPTTTELSNGDYTSAKITDDQDGNKVINYLNPNVRGRLVYNYDATRNARDAGYPFPSESGQGMIEFALILALVAVVGIVVLTILGPQIQAAYHQVMCALPNVPADIICAVASN
jgi:Flp pilus assembly pilin Flp